MSDEAADEAARMMTGAMTLAARAEGCEACAHWRDAMIEHCREIGQIDAAVMDIVQAVLEPLPGELRVALAKAMSDIATLCVNGGHHRHSALQAARIVHQCHPEAEVPV